MLPHVPLAPKPFSAADAAWHNPLHAVSAQKPSTQLLLWQLVPATHAAPFAILVLQLFVLVSQKFPSVHCESLMHEVAHDPLLHANGLHCVTAPALQVPAPLHVPAPTATLVLAQDAALHCVPAAYN
jgi:hypothetical protein